MNLMNIVSTGHRKGPNFKGYPIIQQNIKGTQYSYPCNTAPKKYRLKQTNTIATACTVKGGK